MPTMLVWFESHPTRRSAAARETQIKGWSHKKKAGLAEGFIDLGSHAKQVQVSLAKARAKTRSTSPPTAHPAV
jgi:predicted GIY-YIG superfamily endonuclease